MIYCQGCGKEMHESAQACPSCGAPSTGATTGGKSKVVAGILAIFLGAFGIHRFYLGNIGLGILYLLFFWTGIPGIVAFIEGLVFLCGDEQKFNAKYNRR
ncbi:MULTISPECIES: TM2 domain-containing protein [Zymobacter]|uniref:Predicted membrane protein n=1 Tax=Zymobacter palmae TaxID=33074 RepID=A0A348HGG4_9GAMM|nr:TM2 domain-containing protein [Zymobacter palmae]BBG30716.1 predicted membrane protein [Zymobacter palmae]